jgi:hypothetical protein
MVELNHEGPAQLSAAEEADLVRYGAISPLAIGALVLGVLSALSLTTLLALFVPVVAVLVALVALRQIGKSNGAIVGRWAALTGLALALVFASTAIGRLVSREFILRAQARQFADQWLQIVREGKLQQAHQLQLPPGERQLAGVSLAQFYANSPAARDQFAALFRGDPLRDIARDGKQSSLRFVRYGQHYALTGLDQLELFYQLHSPVSEKRREFMVVVERMTQGKGSPGTWRLNQVRDPSQQL